MVDPQSTFNPDKAIPDLHGKVFLVTGGNAGLGKETVLQLAKHNPQNIFLAARDKKRADDAIADIKKAVPNASITFLPLDLSSLESVHHAAETVKASTQRLDVLVNNAGIMATPAGQTREGYEIQFGTNHMGHALLTKELMPLLKKTAAMPSANVRVVSLSSDLHTNVPKRGILFESLKTPMESTSTLSRYGQSKLANILYIRELAKRDTEPHVLYVAVHPGVVNTNLTDPFLKVHPYVGVVFKGLAGLFLKSVKEGALTQLWASTSGDVETGNYYVPVGKAKTGSAFSRDPELARNLYNWTETELSKFGK